jgi:hypothetical protein
MLFHRDGMGRKLKCKTAKFLICKKAVSENVWGSSENSGKFYG